MHNCKRLSICSALKNPCKECTHPETMHLWKGKYITVYHNGRIHCMTATEWAQHCNTDRNTIVYRLSAPNWTTAQAVGLDTKPPYKILNPHKSQIKKGTTKGIVHVGGDSYYLKTKFTHPEITKNVMMNIFLQYVPKPPSIKLNELRRT